MDFHWYGHKRISTRTRNLKDALQKAIVLEAELLNGSYEGSAPKSTRPRRQRVDSITFSEAIEKYLSYHNSEGTRPKTFIRYGGILRIFNEFLEAEGNTANLDITVEAFDQFRQRRSGKVGPTTMFHEATCIKRFLNWCVTRKLLQDNPLRDLQFRKPKSKQETVLSLEQVKQIIVSAKGPRKSMIQVLALTGMRVSELRNLRCEDIDLTNGWIHIVNRVGFENKAGADWKVPIHEELRPILGRQLRGRHGFLFTAEPSPKYPEGDNHIRMKGLNEYFRSILGTLGIPEGKRNGGFTLHSLRHFFKTYAVASGIPKEYVDLWQGHSLDTRNASNAYLHLPDQDSRAWMEKLPF